MHGLEGVYREGEAFTIWKISMVPWGGVPRDQGLGAESWGNTA